MVKNSTDGFSHHGIKYYPFSNLNIEGSAFILFSQNQKDILNITLFIIASCFLINWHAALTFFISSLTVIYFSNLFFNLFLVLKSVLSHDRITKSPYLNIFKNRKIWPSYTILCPLYKEVEILPQFVSAIKNLDYPKNNLQVLLMLEENDYPTINEAKDMDLPPYFKIIIVPDSKPKTKPKACNYGLLFATGTYLVIYDAEDIPEIDQLKKSVVVFETSPPDIVCLQAKLNFYNTSQNLLTRLFTLEYTLWFNTILIGLQSINAPIPLGGTSNHFKATALKHLKGWDAFNVTEDCDIGLRIAELGLKTAMLDSTTFEEANSSFFGWIRQRSRWIKGYLQTYLVHLRKLSKFRKDKQLFNIFIFQQFIGGTVMSLLINPFMWIILISYYAFRPEIGSFIESFYSGPILYMAGFSVIFGNFLYLYYYMMANVMKKNYALIPFTFILPFYWLMMSLSAWIAIYGISIKPFYWSKTKHGLHLPVLSPHLKLKDVVVI